MNPTDFLRETVDLVRQIETRFLELAAKLYRVRYEELWNYNYSSYEEFLETARISPSVASVLVKVHQHYVINGHVDNDKLVGVGYSNLYEAIPLLAHQDVETVIAKAKLLTRAEIKEEVREEQHGECQHLEHIKICASCKKRIYETQTEQG